MTRGSLAHAPLEPALCIVTRAVSGYRNGSRALPIRSRPLLDLAKDARQALGQRLLDGIAESVRECLAEDHQGQVRRWLFPIGETDVVRNDHGNVLGMAIHPAGGYV